MPRSRFIFASALATLIASVSLILLALFTAASAPGTVLAAAKGGAAVPPAGAKSAPECGRDWEGVASPNVGIFSALSSVAAISNSDIWAVGYSMTYTPTQSFTTLTEHWDGSAWSIVPSPNVGGLTGVAAASSTDVWAVGSYVIEHWNGSTWSIVPGATGALTGIDAVSTTDVWAVGYFSDANGTNTLTEHWDGATWSVVASPNVGTHDSYLNGITAISSSDMWAAGYANTGNSYVTLIEHWDGSVWSIVPSPNAGTYNTLNGLSAASSTDVWAVGSLGYFNTGLIEHWDGSTWSIVPAPRWYDSDELYSVVALSSTDAWAVGIAHTVYHVQPIRPLVEHWDGTTWSNAEEAEFGEYVNDITAVPGGDLWIVGYYISDSTTTVTARYHPDPCPPTATPVPPRCPGERFTDVCPGDYFYQHVLDLNDLGVVSGYTTTPPCEGEAYIPCFKPESSATRGQIAKIVSLAAGFNEDVTGQTFADVPPDSTFYQYIERMASRGIIAGYPCGGPAEPCDSDSKPYFRPGNTVTRGQLSKMTSLAFGFADEVTGQTFADVLPASTFYTDVERLAARDIISGYPCGGASEPCDSENRSYFRPSSDVTRGQIAKIVNLARIVLLPTPTVTTTPEATNTPTAIVTGTVTVTDTVTPVTTTETPTIGPTETSTSTSTPTP